MGVGFSKFFVQYLAERPKSSSISMGFRRPDESLREALEVEACKWRDVDVLRGNLEKKVARW